MCLLVAPLGGPIECGFPEGSGGSGSKSSKGVDPLGSIPLSGDPSTMLVMGAGAGYSPWKNKENDSGIAPFLNQREKFTVVKIYFFVP